MNPDEETDCCGSEEHHANEHCEACHGEGCWDPEHMGCPACQAQLAKEKEA